ncbi:MAG: transposase [Verrucomicrobiaceae bacterium]
MVRVHISRNGFRTRCLWLATTLCDAKRYPAQKLAELYYRRWSIELFYRDVKSTMHMEVLRTKSPEMIEKELLMHAIAYNAIRLILRAAAMHQQQLGRMLWPRRGGPHDNGSAGTSCHDRPRKQPAGATNCWKPSPACATRCGQDAGAQGAETPAQNLSVAHFTTACVQRNPAS